MTSTHTGSEMNDYADAATASARPTRAVHPVLEPAVTLEAVGPVAWVRLNRPDQLNAFSQQLMDDLNAVLDAVDADESIRVIVVTGNGRAFSAGGDLKQFKGFLDSGDHQGVIDFIDLSARTLTRLEENPRPVIAAVNGTAVAGGLELILCCDLVIADGSALIGDGHLKFGVLPGAGGAARLVRKVPPNIASRMLLTGELYAADYLHRWGLIDEVVESSRVTDVVTELAERLALLSPLALAHVKGVARRSSTEQSAEGLRHELDAFRSYVSSSDFREGMDAFMTRRTPHFEGK